jgi:hypothetical protein
MRSTIHSWDTIFAKLRLIKKRRRSLGGRNRFTRSLRMEPLEKRRMLAITVNTTVDELDGELLVDVSLRDAIDLAPVGETINFAPSINSIALLNGTNLGEIAFDKSLTIDGGTAGVTIHAAANNRIFHITGGGSTLVTMKGLTLTGGDVTGNGGAISSTSSLDIRNCTITGNNAARDSMAIAA